MTITLKQLIARSALVVLIVGGLAILPFIHPGFLIVHGAGALIWALDNV